VAARCCGLPGLVALDHVRGGGVVADGARRLGVLLFPVGAAAQPRLLLGGVYIGVGVGAGAFVVEGGGGQLQRVDVVQAGGAEPVDAGQGGGVEFAEPLLASPGCLRGLGVVLPPPLGSGPGGARLSCGDAARPAAQDRLPLQPGGGVRGAVGAAQPSCLPPPDADGNRLSYTTPGANGTTVTQRSHYNPDNSLRDATDGTAANTVSTSLYNAASVLIDDGCYLYTDDGFDRQTRAQPKPGSPCASAASNADTSYRYDGLDRQRGRDQTTKSTTTTLYTDGTQTSATSTTSSSTTMSYDGLSATVASQTSTPAGGPAAPPTRYTLDPEGSPVSASWQKSDGTTSTDHLADDGFGTISTITGRTGSTSGGTPTGFVACATRFDPWGRPATDPHAGTATGTPPTGGTPGPGATMTGTRRTGTGVGLAPTPCRTSSTDGSPATPADVFYTGQRRDTGTGNYQLGSRTYDPGKAAFLTPDTYRDQQPQTDLAIGTDPLTQNRYTYVNGDPVNLSDPSGHEPSPNGGTNPNAAPTGCAALTPALRVIAGCTLSPTYPTASELRRRFRVPASVSDGLVVLLYGPLASPTAGSSQPTSRPTPGTQAAGGVVGVSPMEIEKLKVSEGTCGARGGPACFSGYFYTDKIAMPNNCTFGYGIVVDFSHGCTDATVAQNQGLVRQGLLGSLKQYAKTRGSDPLDSVLKSNGVTLNQQQYDALADYVFNGGRYVSTLVGLAKQRDTAGVVRFLTTNNRTNANRRCSEAAIYARGNYNVDHC